MTSNMDDVGDLERKAREADRMAAKSPFQRDRERFADVAKEYRLRAERLRR